MTEQERIEQFRNHIAKYLPETAEQKLVELRFFNAPASTKYHLSYEGGLFDHSINVTFMLTELTKRMGLKWQNERSPYVIGMLHDLCKCDLYIKLTDGSFSFNKLAPDLRHGEKSVDLAKKILDLTDEEIACIQFHMGAFIEKEKWPAYSQAVQKYENVLWTHTADMYASNVLEIHAD